VFDSEPICLPIQIKPDRLSMAAYDIKYDKETKTILNVINQTYGSVKFTS
jgi:hypothetical protein